MICGQLQDDAAALILTVQRKLQGNLRAGAAPAQMNDMASFIGIFLFLSVFCDLQFLAVGGLKIQINILLLLKGKRNGDTAG